MTSTPLGCLRASIEAAPGYDRAEAAGGGLLVLADGGLVHKADVTQDHQEQRERPGSPQAGLGPSRESDD